LLAALLVWPALAQPTGGPREISPVTDAQPRQFRVLDSQEVDVGPRWIIFNRVETPPLLPQPAPAEQAATPAIPPIPTAEALEEMRTSEALNYVGLLLSCTVYDDALTQVCFRHADADITFWSTINFHYLSPVIDLRAGDAAYILMMAIGDSTKQALDQQDAEFRPPPADLLDAAHPGSP
jgi:hypothetical protein